MQASLISGKAARKAVLFAKANPLQSAFASPLFDCSFPAHLSAYSNRANAQKKRNINSICEVENATTSNIQATVPLVQDPLVLDPARLVSAAICLIVCDGVDFSIAWSGAKVFAFGPVYDDSTPGDAKTCQLAQQERISTGLIVLPDIIDPTWSRLVVFDAPKVRIPWISLIT